MEPTSQHESPEELFRNIETRIERLMKKRREANKALFGGNIPFDKFWKDYCQTPQEWAVQAFYGGTAMLLSGTILWTWSEFTVNYVSFYGAVFGIVPIGIGLPVAFAIYVYLTMRHSDFMQEEHEADQAEQATDLEKKLKNVSPLPRNIASMGNIKSPTFAGMRIGHTLPLGLGIGSSSYDSRDHDGMAGGGAV